MNMFQHAVLLTVVLTYVRSDIFLDVLKQSIDHKSNACDNLYRYTCPLGVNTTISQELVKRIEPISSSYDAISNTIQDLYPFYNVVVDLPMGENFIELISKSFRGKCSEKIFAKYKTAFNFTGVQSCIVTDNNYFSKKISEMKRKLEVDARYSMTFIKLCDRFNLTNGVIYLDKLFEQMKTILKEDMKQTKWLEKHNQTEIAIKAIEKIQLLQGSKNQNSVKLFFEQYETCFESCSKDFPNKDEASNVICSLYGYSCASPHHFVHIDVLYNMNAANEHNNVITMGLPFILYASEAQNDVLKASLISSILSHELAHTFMNSITASNDNIFSYFPSAAEDCITKQFERSCDNFREVNCFMTFRQVEECGSDIIGMNLAYKTFKKVTDTHNYQSIIDELRISNIDQLFFLTYWNILCKPETISTDEVKDHPASNIRVNAVVQLAEFQKSFNCSESSPMMKSKTEQCFIYGKQSTYE